MQIGFRSPPGLRTRVYTGVLIATVAVLLGTGGLALAAKHGHKPKGHKAPHGHLSISSQTWGTAHGQTVKLFTLRNGNGMVVRISNYGGVVQSIVVPDRDGKRRNVALGFPTLSDYVNDFENQPWPAAGRVRRHLLRRDHRPLREPHRRRAVHPQRQRLPAGIRAPVPGDSNAQQRARPASRRTGLLQHPGVGGDRRRPRRTACR